jgi:hypothetical protein
MAFSSLRLEESRHPCAFSAQQDIKSSLTLSNTPAMPLLSFQLSPVVICSPFFPNVARMQKHSKPGLEKETRHYSFC